MRSATSVAAPLICEIGASTPIHFARKLADILFGRDTTALAASQGSFCQVDCSQNFHPCALALSHSRSASSTASSGRCNRPDSWPAAQTLPDRA